MSRCRAGSRARNCDWPSRWWAISIPIAWNWPARRPAQTRCVASNCSATVAISTARVLPGDWLIAGELLYCLEIHTAEMPCGGFPKAHTGSKSGGWRIRILPAEAPAVIFDAARDRVTPGGSEPYAQRIVETAEPEHKALQISVTQFAPPPSAVSFRHEVDDELDPWRDVLADRTTLRLRAAGTEPSTALVEFVLLERDGAAWGTNVPLSTQWQDVRVPLSSLRYFSHWAGTPESRAEKGPSCTRRTWPP